MHLIYKTQNTAQYLYFQSTIFTVQIRPKFIDAILDLTGSGFYLFRGLCWPSASACQILTQSGNASFVDIWYLSAWASCVIYVLASLEYIIWFFFYFFKFCLWMRSFLECHDTLLIFLFVCEKICINDSKCWCSNRYQLYESIFSEKNL